MSYMRLWRLALALTLAGVLGGCATIVPPPALATPDPGAAHAAWARVLQSHVDDRGQVDFQALAEQRGDLDRYLRYVADTRLETLPAGPERLAHLINAYNALSMFNVIASGIPASHAGVNKLRFFVLRRFTVAGQPRSLYGLENDVIRPLARALGEPRVHFALNCSARSCPVLPRLPFTADDLAGQLERETRAFFARADNLRIDPAARTVWLSELLDFYPEDFVPAHAASLLDYARRYAPQPLPEGYRVRYTPYDWTVANSRPR